MMKLKVAINCNEVIYRYIAMKKSKKIQNFNEFKSKFGMIWVYFFKHE